MGRPIADGVHDIGGVDDGRARRPPRRVTIFRAERTVKGRLEAERIAVLHGTDSAACGIVFDPEERYLLAFRRGKDAVPGPLRINLCGVRRLESRPADGES